MTISKHSGRPVVRELVRYGLVGATINALGYLAYLGIVGLGADPKLAVTIVYGTAVVIGFVANRNLTFGHEGRMGRAAVRYLAVQFTGYLIDVAMLEVGVDRWGYPHELVQALAVGVVAVFLFVTMKLFVFRSETGDSA